MVTLARMARYEPDESFVRLFREHGPAMVEHVARILRNRQDAEDVAQEAFSKAYRLAQPETLRNPRAWLLMVAGRMAITHLKRAARRPTVPLTEEVEAVPDERPSLEAQGIGEDTLRHLQALVGELPPQQARAFYLYRILGESRKEVAAQLGITVNTFDQHLAKAERYCQQELEALGLGLQGGEKS